MYTYWLPKKILAFYHVNPHIISFPAIYNTWGLNLEEPTLKNWRIPKNTTFWADLLAIFSNCLTFRRSGDFFCIENLLFKSLTVMAWYGASNWAIRKLSEGIIVQVMSNIVKHVIYRGNLSKIHSFAKNAKFHNFLVPWIFLDGTTGKLRSQAFRISITLIGFLLK